MFTGGPYWIEAGEGVRLATMPRPLGGEKLTHEIARIRAAGVEVVASLLEPHEKEALELGREAELCKLQGIEYLEFPVRDHAVPSSPEATRAFARELSARLDRKAAIAIHCFAGIGRSSLIAASVLIIRGSSVKEAFSRISRARGFLVPDTHEQAQWVEAHIQASSPSRTNR
jgi:protein-tyrosine phosphatase